MVAHHMGLPKKGFVPIFLVLSFFNFLKLLIPYFKFYIK